MAQDRRQRHKDRLRQARVDKGKQKRLDNGMPVVSEAEFKQQRQEKSVDRIRQLDAALYAPKSFAIPEDVQLEAIQENDPELCAAIVSHATIRAQQTDSEYRTRAIWYNEWDPRHNFSQKYQQTHLVFSILSARLANDEELNELALYYIAACLERGDEERGAKPGFEKRDAFIKAWLKSDFDFHLFTRTDVKQMREVKDALEEAMGKINEALDEEFPIEEGSASGQDDGVPPLPVSRKRPREEEAKEDGKKQRVSGEDVSDLKREEAESGETRDEAIASVWKLFHDDYESLISQDMNDPEVRLKVWALLRLFNKKGKHEDTKAKLQEKLSKLDKAESEDIDAGATTVLPMRMKEDDEKA